MRFRRVELDVLLEPEAETASSLRVVGRAW
jgi:hypothetical protein